MRGVKATDRRRERRKRVGEGIAKREVEQVSGGKERKERKRKRGIAVGERRQRERRR